MAILKSFRNSPLAITSFEKALESSSITFSRARDGVANPKSGTHQVAIQAVENSLLICAG